MASALIEVFTNPSKTYATRDNAIKAIEKEFVGSTIDAHQGQVRYVVAVTAEGRFYPVIMCNPRQSHLILAAHRGWCVHHS
jgi:hypothetical protein